MNELHLIVMQAQRNRNLVSVPEIRIYYIVLVEIHLKAHLTSYSLVDNKSATMI